MNRRINFHLQDSLAVSLAEEAALKGCSSSEILRIWIKSKPIISLSKLSGFKKYTSFNFHLNEDVLKTLDKSARLYGLSISMYLRLLLHYYLDETQSGVLPNNKQLLNLYLRGSFLEIINLLDIDIEKLDVQSLPILIVALTNTSNFGKAKETICLLNNKREEMLTCSIRSQIAVDEREFSMAKTLIRNLDHHTICTETLNSINVQKGLIEAMSGDRNKAERFFTEAYNYYQAQKTSYNYTRSCIYLSFIQLSNNNLGLAEFYLDKAEESMIILKSPTARSWLNTSKARLLYLKGHYRTAESILIAEIVNFKRFGNCKALTDTYGFLSLTNIQQNKSDAALKNIQHAQKHEDTFRRRKTDGLTAAIRLFLLSKHYYKSSMTEMKELLITSSVKKFNKLYLCHTAQLLHGPSSRDKQGGIVGLKKLINSNAHTQIKHAAAKTLKTNQVQPVSV